MFASKKTVSMKAMVLLLAVVLLFGCAAGGTLAWLTTRTTDVVNNFTTSDINITLDESDDLDLQMVPGTDIEKDPVVAVEEGSEDCWLFVKVVAENGAVLTGESDADDYITYTIADGWSPVPGADNVYYRKVAADATDRDFEVLADNKVHVLDTVTKAMMEAIDNGAAAPKLTFTAYAVQQVGFDELATDDANAAAAWAEASKLG